MDASAKDGQDRDDTILAELRELKHNLEYFIAFRSFPIVL